MPSLMIAARHFVRPGTSACRALSTSAGTISSDDIAAFVASGLQDQIRVLKSLRDSPSAAAAAKQRDGAAGNLVGSGGGLGEYAQTTSGDNIARAWQLFDGLVDSGKADAHCFEVMLKTCYSSVEQRRLIEEVMPKAGVRPTEVAYRTLANMMRIEGQSREIVAAEVGKAMAGAKVALAGKTECQAKTLEALDRPAEVVARMRTARLAGWLAQEGPKDSADGAAAAWNLFNSLVESGKANEFHFGVMLADACHSSAQQRQVITELMPNAGVTPNNKAFTCLMQMLRMEGDDSAALAILEEEMPAAGIVPDRRARFAATGATAEDVASMRAARIRRLAVLGSDEAAAAAWSMVESSSTSDYTKDGDASACHAMIEVCQSSADLRKLAEETMPSIGLPEGDYTVRRALAAELRAEGKAAEAAAEEEAMVASGDWANMGFQPSRAALFRSLVAGRLEKPEHSAAALCWVDDAVLQAKGADIQAMDDKQHEERMAAVKIAGETAGVRSMRSAESVRYGQPARRLNA